MPIKKDNFKIRIGTRGSKLALAQALEMRDLILKNSGLVQNQIEIIKIKTSGDKIKDVSLADIGGKGLFIKELEESLVEKKIDIAIHSTKDVPPILHQDTQIAAFSHRIDVRDYFISKKFSSINQLPKNSVVGTSSARRKAILLKMRPDLKIVNFRGNVDTRLQKIEDDAVDATVLALCGLKRIGKDIDEKHAISIEDMLPAVGQGSLTLQIRKDDRTIFDIVAKINHQETEICVAAERDFLRILRASCRSPISVYCNFEADKIRFRSTIYDLDGKEFYARDFSQNISTIEKFDKKKEIALSLAQQAAYDSRDNARDLLERICR